MGVYIIELMDITLSSYMIQTIRYIITNFSKINLKTFEKEVVKFTDILIKYDKKIKHDIIEAAKMNIYNYDNHQENIMLDKSGQVYITDWGLAKTNPNVKEDFLVFPYEKYNFEYYYTASFLTNLRSSIKSKPKIRFLNTMIDKYAIPYVKINF